MSEMVERVAVAIYSKHLGSSGHPWNDVPDEFREGMKILARAAIAAMRDPTEAMLLAGGDLNSMGDYPSPGISWERMIDEALK